MHESRSAEQLMGQWSAAWNNAVRIWSPYVQLRSPIFCMTEEDERAAGLSSSFAMIRLTDFSVVVSLRQVANLDLGDFPLEILAHETGHHVYCPADLTDNGRMIGRIQAAMPGYEGHAAMIGNIYADLLINDRLFREHGLRMDVVYKKVKNPGTDRFWNFYMRTYEILWTLSSGTLAGGEIETETEGDAILAARIIRNFARHWLKGAGEFAAVCYRYLLESAGPSQNMSSWMDAAEPGDSSTIPSGLASMDRDEDEAGTLPSELRDKKGGAEEKGAAAPGSSYREPFQYGQILRAMGIDLSEREIAARYYRERAIPYLIKFPSRVKPESAEPLPEGLQEWEPGSPVEDINWFESMIKSPVLIPGYTTVERIEGTSKGNEPAREPVDLDIYIDSSGSMPDPAVNTSYLTLAGAVICLSALRSGSRVQATLWSGTNEFMKTSGFVRNEKEIMEILTGFYGGATAFPIHVLRDTYMDKKAGSRRVHILVISDDGVTTMFDNDEQGNSGREIAVKSLQKCGAGGTFALNIYSMDKDLEEAARMGWDIYPVTDWEGLMKFSRDFVKKHYGGR